MIDSLLALDTDLLIQARGLIGPEYAKLIQMIGEIVVVYGALLLLALWFIGVYKKDNAWKTCALQIFFTIILTFVVYTIVNFGVPQWRPNPQEVVGGIGALIPHPLDNSFPSGHALFTAALFVGLVRFYPKALLLLGVVLFGLMTALARVIGGVHYPGDILGGFILGGLGATFISFLLDGRIFREYVSAPLIRIAKVFYL